MKKTIYLMFLIIVISITVYSFKNVNVEVDLLKFDYEHSSNQYEFQWSKPNNSYLTELRKEFKLDELVKDSEDDLDKILIVTNWVHNLWEHDGSNQPKKRDPISILREVQKGEQFRCVEYAVVINGCLNALGIPSRVIGLKTKDVETRKSGAGHVVVEAYLRDLNKWVMVDGQWNVIPIHNGDPINTVELQRVLANGEEGLSIASLEKNNKSNFFRWIVEYLYYFDTGLDNRFVSEKSYKRLMLVPIGANEPNIFQIKHPIGDFWYTNSYKDFYPEP